MPGPPLLRNLDVGGRKVLLRLDLNLPMDADDRVTDDTRIQRALPTLRDLAERGARTVILSHRGRPGGREVDGLSLRPVVAPLSAAIGAEVEITADCIGRGPEVVAEQLKPGAFLLLENLRFDAGEEANDPHFAQALTRLG